MSKKTLSQIVQLNEDTNTVLNSILNSLEYKNMINKINTVLNDLPDEDYALMKSTIVPRIIDKFKHNFK